MLVAVQRMLLNYSQRKINALKLSPKGNGKMS